MLSFVALGAGGPRDRVQLGFRYDLPDPPGPEAAARTAGHAVSVLAQRGLSTVIGIGYGPGPLVTPVADAFASAARQRGLHLRELLRVEDGRYWSYLCADSRCCPADGVPFDYGTHPAAAAMTAAGLAARPDRETLVRSLAPLGGDAAQSMEQAIERASAKAAGLVARARHRGSRNSMRFVIEEGRRAVRQAIAAYAAGGSITDDDQAAWLLVTLANLPVRDDAWARMVPEQRETNLRLWADMVRRASPAWVPAPAGLLAFTAWQCGDGALANVALDRALAADPSYSMAHLLREVLDAGIPPSQARLPMSPEEVARSYARADRRKPRGRTGREATQNGDH